MARLAADFASIEISNSHVICSKSTNESKIPCKTEGSLLLPIQIGNNSHDEGTKAGATVSLNLCSQILDSFQYTLSDASQHSTRMICCFHCQYNGFIDYFDDIVLDG